MKVWKIQKIQLFHKPIPLNAPRQKGEIVYTTLQLSRLRRTAINFQRIAIMAMIGMFLSGVMFAIGSWVTDTNRVHNQCVSANRGRVEIKQAFKGLYDGFVYATPPGNREAAIAFRDKQMRRLEAALPQRDC